MNKKILNVGFVFVVIALLAISMVMGKEDTSSNDLRKVTVNGQYSMDVAPDVAFVYLGITNDALTAKEAGEKNAQVMDKVKKALINAGVNKKDIEVSNYYLNPKYNWRSGSSTIIGHTASHTLKVKTTDIKEVGKLIDAALGAGANRVNNVQFDLSKEKRQKVNQEILGKAAQDARSKAKILATSLDAKLGKVITITENSYNYRPYYRTMDNVVSMGKAEIAPTQINPREVKTSANVQVVFELK
jgi:hypothetical protein